MLVVMQVPIQIRVKSLSPFRHDKAGEKLYVQSNMLKPT